MSGYHTIRTETWQLMIPPDWQDRGEDEDGVLCFQSADESKGFYISVLRLSPSDHNGDPDGVLEMLCQAEMEGFAQMEDYQWTFPEESTTSDGAARIAVVEAHDAARQYRIVAKTIVTLPFVVRASFHDYACEDYKVSRRFFDPIVQSLEVPNVA
jgi:hypothetical protein